MNKVLLSVFMLFLTSCATPDLSSFNTTSLALQQGLIENQTQLVSAGREMSSQIGNPDSLDKGMDKLEIQGRKVKQIVTALAAYANSVSQLSSSGTKGSEAAGQMISDMETAVSGISGSPLTFPDEISELFDVLKIIENQKNNKALHEIMSSIAPEVNQLPIVLDSLRNSEEVIIGSIDTYWSGYHNDLKRFHEIYEKLLQLVKEVNQDIAADLQSDVNKCAGALNCDYKAIHNKLVDNQGEAMSQKKDIEALLTVIEVHELQYRAKQKEFDEWKSQRLNSIKSIPQLAKAWKKDHASVVQYLKSCKNAVSILKPECKAFSASNLELFGTLLGKAIVPF